MKNLKIGMFPGRVEDYVVEDGTTVGEALRMAGIEPTTEQEIKLDGRVVELTNSANGNLLLVAKRIKGAK